MNIKLNKKNIVTYILLLLFLILTILVFTNNFSYIDDKIESFILSIRNKNLTDTMNTITNIGSAYSLIVITILLLFFLKNKKTCLLITLNLIFSFLSSQIVKFILQRERPINIGLVSASGYSYPSGHSMVSMAYFGFIAYLIYKNISNVFLKIIFIMLFILLSIVIGFSRIYLGVHYFSDVLGGFLLSIFYLSLFININNTRINEERK